MNNLKQKVIVHVASPQAALKNVEGFLGVGW